MTVNGDICVHCPLGRGERAIALGLVAALVILAGTWILL